MDILVVEGRHDYARLKDIFSGLIITTNGSEISDKTLNLLKEYSKNNRIIVFTDPDYPGERIRKRITEVCPNASHIFIKNKFCKSKNNKKVGVEHADIEDLKALLKDIFEPTQNNKFWDLNKLIELKLSSDINSKSRREYISDKLNIGSPNTKTLINRLNSFNIGYNTVLKLVEEYDKS